MGTAPGTRVHHFAVQLHLSLQRGRKRHPQKLPAPEWRNKPATLVQEPYTEVAPLQQAPSAPQPRSQLHVPFEVCKPDAGESDTGSTKDWPIGWTTLGTSS